VPIRFSFINYSFYKNIFIMYNNSIMMSKEKFTEIPFCLSPIYLEKPWGGSRLTGKKHIGEALLVSVLDNYVSVIEGTDIRLDNLIKEYPEKLLGADLVKKYGKTLPVCCKLIDAAKSLSVQVHPDDAAAKRLENQKFGKTEAWYILEAGKDASIYLGIKKGTNKKQFYDAILNNDDVIKYLNRIPVKKGDMYFIPAGLVHSIGEGVLLFEVQQNSNTTYRVYDYNRKGLDGKSRELHIEKAMEVINFPGEFNSGINSVRNIESDFFNMGLVRINSGSEHRLKFDNDNYRMLFVITGSVERRLYFIPSACRDLSLIDREGCDAVALAVQTV
ncbi:MAG: class I mannose-6-phosphate isomerase, partial [Oligoflexia bacterium]|nr:class I mannose-6-phosphate isomerase [Oligoflexia bacterium]